jgi:hydrogenase expression/formation protein HypE
MDRNEVILIGHGSGGRLTRELIENIFIKYFGNPILSELHDASQIQVDSTMVAFTTDSYVIDPIFFPGGDIGKLSISGTVNDLCVSGAIPRYISCGFIIEEGLPLYQLEKIAKSMAEEAKRAGVKIVAGDTKVVKRGQCDALYINTSGIGMLPPDRLHISNGNTIRPGDKILVSGMLGDHAIAILAKRENLILEKEIQSDAASLNTLTEKILNTPSDVRFMRDITRGGLATVLTELCENKDFGIVIDEKNIPVRQSVQAICELYGFEPLYLANEGKMMLIVRKGVEDKILQLIQSDDLGEHAAIVGEITDKNPGKVILNSTIGGRRMVDMLSGEMLPRIC